MEHLISEQLTQKTDDRLVEWLSRDGRLLFLKKGFCLKEFGFL